LDSITRAIIDQHDNNDHLRYITGHPDHPPPEVDSIVPRASTTTTRPRTTTTRPRTTATTRRPTATTRRPTATTRPAPVPTTTCTTQPNGKCKNKP
jgi:hypothetical protein